MADEPEEEFEGESESVPDRLARLNRQMHRLGNAFQQHDLRLLILEEQEKATIWSPTGTGPRLLALENKVTRLWRATCVVDVLIGLLLVWACVQLWLG